MKRENKQNNQKRAQNKAQEEERTGFGNPKLEGPNRPST